MQEVKKLNERGKKMLNAKYEVSAFIYIYIDSIRIDKYMGT